MQTTIILADNQDITRIGIQSLLVKIGADSFYQERAEDVAELEAILLRSEAPIVIIDLDSLEIGSPKELLTLFEKQPMTRWIIFQDEINDQELSVFGGMPSVSMILKSNSGEEIRAALKSVIHAERFLCHQVSNRILTRKQQEEDSHLTQSETEILRLIALGKTVKEIAAIRFSSAHTIVTHKKNIFRKIEVNNIYEATKYALRTGLLEADYYI